MMKSSYKSGRHRAVASLLFLATAFPATSQEAPSRQADPNEVGRQMAIMLQNGHFARLSFSSLNGRFLQHYLKELDPARVYFTADDVAGFEKNYGTSLDCLLLQQEAMTAANAIYEVYRIRALARVAEAERLLKDNAFDFTLQESMPLSRKDAPWPRDEAAAMGIWKLQVKGALLAEILRRESATSKPSIPPEQTVAARYSRLRRSVTTDLGPQEISSLFFSAVARSFDPHSDYLNAIDLKRFYEEMRNETVGIGALLQSQDDGTTQIQGILTNGPADRQGGLAPGDRITAVDPDGDGPREMTDISFMGVDQVIGQIRGARGEKVALKIEPAIGPPGGPEIVTIIRDQVPLKDQQARAQLVEIRSANGGPAVKLGLLTLPSFYGDFQDHSVSSSEDVSQLLSRLRDEGMQGLLFDLRGNGGGVLSEVQRITGFFTGPGPVVQVKDSIGRVEVLKSASTKAIFTGPMVLLTDRGSASASEILAAALQDQGRAVIVGDASTFGKGTVQVIKEIGPQMPFFSVRNGAGGLRLTIQKFYRPSGISTQNLGVVPDIILPSLGSTWEGGESSLDNALPQDRIAPAAGFQPPNLAALHLPELMARSSTRVAASDDFAGISAEASRLKLRREENRISLNLIARREEVADTTATAARSDAERKARFTSMQASDRERLTFYSLTLDDLAAGGALRKVDPEAADHPDMKLAAGASTPRWPSRLDPQKRESLAILEDLVSLKAG